ncbi:MAG TPA: hypothetical protein VM578_00290 [Candidatus Saccharimonadales bacterium]|nr:hypothetical protein [Candidatus Saccharimonadales bacterium]
MAIACGVLTLAACKVSHENHGDNEKVSVEAPGASVKVDTETTANDSGIPLYPGAQEKQGSGDDKGRANVNVSTPFLKVKVVALKFTADDPPEKVLAFYRSKLGSYGNVVECKGKAQDVEIGSGRGPDSPVTCGKDQAHGDEVRLKVGTEGNQHDVAVKPNGKGSEFELIYVHLGNTKNDDSFGGKQPS